MTTSALVGSSVLAYHAASTYGTDWSYEGPALKIGKGLHFSAKVSYATTAFVRASAEYRLGNTIFKKEL